MNGQRRETGRFFLLQENHDAQVTAQKHMSCASTSASANYKNVLSRRCWGPGEKKYSSIDYSEKSTIPREVFHHILLDLDGSLRRPYAASPPLQHGLTIQIHT